jgi:hypothetical protein
MMAAVNALFDQHQVDGYVDMVYETQLFYERLS